MNESIELSASVETDRTGIATTAETVCMKRRTEGRLNNYTEMFNTYRQNTRYKVSTRQKKDA